MKSIASLACVAVLLGFASMAVADPVGGPSRGVTRVQAYGVNVHKVLYRGGEQADFEIAGDGDTVLTLIVRDANGSEVIRISGRGSLHTYWTPSQTSFYTISVVNQGGVYNQYAYHAF